LLNQYGLKRKVIAYVNNEGSNLNIMTIDLKFVMRCEILSLDESYQSTYFSHVFCNACQYVIIDKKDYKNFRFVFVKSTQSYLQKCITCLKKSRKDI
jgi:hypothetical protein